MDDVLEQRTARLRSEGLLIPGHGPLLRLADGAPKSAANLLGKLWTTGRVARLCPGVYIGLERWAAMAPWDRYTAACAAYALTHPAARFTGVTAAHLYGLPLAETPREIWLRSRVPGHRAKRAMTASPFSDAARGRNRQKLWALPVVRWTWNGVEAPVEEKPRRWRGRLALAAIGWTAWPAAPLAPATVEAQLKDGTPLGAVTVDPLPTLQLLLGSTLPFREAVVALDGLHRRLPGPSQTWAENHAHRLRSRAATQRFTRAWSFSDARAESAGESLARALIHELGFVAPQLQRRFFAQDGREIARTDFWWEDVRVAGEFDGIGKYDVDLHADPRDRRNSINREKQRDVELRRVCRDVTHWTWADLKDPRRLEAELLRVGVPRRQA
ncbi:hypothetical protein [Micrococcus lylae]|uniref:hypothetical protein n=1 Tax=Micrococcus lylae TaxID=1273 RepID=UPI000C7F7A43|nr:hypothetical protein [Micrococcus lylae]WIK82033.1 hypothetical protein CJ228_010660 [Micrococcus lylae]